MANKVKFRFGSWANYNKLTEKDTDTVYFITDKKLVFKGSTLCGHVVSTATTGEGAAQVVKFTYNNGSDTDVTVSLPTASAVDSKISAHNVVPGSGAVYGHVKLSDALIEDNLNFNTGNGTAATPKAVYLALSAAKSYTDEKLQNVADALVFKGTLGVSGSGATVTELPDGSSEHPYEVGWTYKVVTSGNYKGHACEAGDLIIAVVARGTLSTSGQDSDWTVVQSNIDGAVTADADFAEDALIVGGGSNRTVKKLANGTVGQVLTTNSDGKPEWAKAT